MDRTTLKGAAQAAARMLGGVEGQKAYAQLCMLGLAAQDSTATCSTPDGKVSTSKKKDTLRRIGIWEYALGANDQRITRKDWLGRGYPWTRYEWADVDTISLKKRASNRLVLVGESVARGFLFEPNVTPAAILTDCLHQATGESEFEVVDLACVGITARKLLELVESTAPLSPDAIILFAGNNWWHAYWDGGIRSYHQGAVALESDLQSFRKAVENYTETFARLVLREIATACQQMGAELFVVVPEFNLIDWHHEWLTPTWLRQPDLERWISLKNVVVEGGRSVGYATQMDSLNEMVGLDSHSVARTQELLGRAHYELGEIDRAANYLETARDMAMWAGLGAVPRCVSVVQRQLREVCNLHPRIHVTNLPSTLRTGSRQLPDRTIFADYCHLTPLGMRLAMTELTKDILRSLGTITAAPPCLEAVRVDSLGASYFLAALHNLHNSQPDEIVEYWMNLALSADSAASGAAKFLLASGNASGRQIVGEIGFPENPAIDLHMKRVGVSDNIDWSVRTALGNRPEFPAQVLAPDRSRPTPHLDLPFCRLARANHPIRAELAFEGRAYSRHLHDCCEYMFSADKDDMFYELGLVLRLSGLAAEDSMPVLLAINRMDLGRHAVRAHWTRLRIPIERGTIRHGQNIIRLQWPSPVTSWETVQKSCVDSLMNRRAPELFVIFGDVQRISFS